MSMEVHHTVQDQQPAGERQRYSTPRFVTFGVVHDLTAAGSASNFEYDGMGGDLSNMGPMG